MDVSRALVAELVSEGMAAHEARWLVQEFVPGEDPDAAVALRAAARRRRSGEPLQYIIGHWPFRTLDLDVDPRVLIPRPETEELVDVALGVLARSGVLAPTILDLGCGSGAIGLALLKELGERGVAAALVAVDKSEEALEVARRNALKHQLRNVSFVRSSWYDEIDESLRGHVDLIVANPPYVGAEELLELDPVLGYEPRDAIVSSDTPRSVGFADLAHIIRGAPQWLAPSGLLVCEHGNAQRDAVLDEAREAGFSSVNDIDDLAGHPRIVVARLS